VDWHASRYSVPWQYAGERVWVREQANEVEVLCRGEEIATHAPAARKHQVITEPLHHESIPLGANREGGKILIHLRERAPAVESRSLAVYESLAIGGAQ